jgi:transposase
MSESRVRENRMHGLKRRGLETERHTSPRQPPTLLAIRNKDSYLSVFYRRIAARRGRPRALVAVMHKLAIAIWHVLHDKVPYRELGADYFAKRDPERAMRRMIKEANSLGMTIRFEPITTT